MKKLIPVKVYSELKAGDTTPAEGEIVNEGGKLYFVLTTAGESDE